MVLCPTLVNRIIEEYVVLCKMGFSWRKKALFFIGRSYEILAAVRILGWSCAGTGLSTLLGNICDF